MANPEIIGLLCAGSVRYHEPLGSGSAAGQLSRSELAGLLSGLSGVAMHLALAKYAGDVDAERSLISHVRQWAAGVAVREQWEIVRGRPTVVNMAALAVFEVVRPNVCTRCNGVGFERNKPCRCCDGSGVKALSGLFIANALKIPETSYRRKWEQRYEVCYRYVVDLESEVNHRLSVADKELINA